MSDPIKALAEASAWNLKHQDRIRELERQLAEAQAQMGAMRKALLERGQHPQACRDAAAMSQQPGYCVCGINAALAPEAGKELLARLEKAERRLGLMRPAEIRDVIPNVVAHWEATAQNAALEKATDLVRRYLMHNDQRPCSWHEAADCQKAILDLKTPDPRDDE